MPEFRFDLIGLRWSLGLRFLEVPQEIKYISRVPKVTQGKGMNGIFPGPRSVISSSGISKVPVKGTHRLQIFTPPDQVITLKHLVTSKGDFQNPASRLRVEVILNSTPPKKYMLLTST